jgi:tonB box
MWKFLQVLLIAILLNGSFYSFNFAFWVSGPNTKMILAVLGVLWFFYDSFRKQRGVIVSEVFLFGGIFSIIYSLINLVAVEVNDTNDYSYANYLTTYVTWIFSVYPAIRSMRIIHGRVTISLITFYLAGLSVFQCITGLLNDNFPIAQELTDKIVFTAQDFYESIDRMRCFSIALDPAGVRFSLVLILIAATICMDEKVQQSKSRLILLFMAYLLISGIGNMVARTTSTGMVLGIVLLFIKSNVIGLRIHTHMVKTMSIFSVLLVTFGGVGVVLYNTSEYFYSQFHFAFEGFFNLFEKGEFTTGSTQVLQTMWRWPEDTKSWIIGTGLYGGYLYSTDIGYCRLILYSGLVGFTTFALSFVYYAYFFARKYPRYLWLFLCFLAMTFIVWSKVSTDILLIYAFFFWFTVEESDYINGVSTEITEEELCA